VIGGFIAFAVMPAVMLRPACLLAHL